MELMLRFFGKSTSIIGQIVHVDMVEVMERHSRVQLLPDDENALIQFCLDAVIQRNMDDLTLPPKFTFAPGGERLLFKQVKSFIYEVSAALSVFGYFNRDEIKKFNICDFFQRNPSLVHIVAFTEPYVRVKNVVDSDIPQTDSDQEELVPSSDPLICPFGIQFSANEFSILSTGQICFTLPETEIDHSQGSDKEEKSHDDDEESATGSATGSDSVYSARSASFGFGGRGRVDTAARLGFGGRGGSTAAALPGFGGSGVRSADSSARLGFGGGDATSSAAAEPRLLPPGQGRGAPLPSSRGRGGKF
jgi:hypothetical protein